MIRKGYFNDKTRISNIDKRQILELLRNWGDMYFSPVGNQKQPVPTEKKSFDILRLKNTALYLECKGTLKDVQLKRVLSVSSYTSWWSSQHGVFKGNFQHLEVEDPNVKHFPGKLIWSFCHLGRIKLGRNRTCVNKNVTESPRQKIISIKQQLSVK